MPLRCTGTDFKKRKNTHVSKFRHFTKFHSQRTAAASARPPTATQAPPMPGACPSRPPQAEAQYFRPFRRSLEPCWQSHAARKARHGRRACVLANNGALPTTPASAPVMRSHRDGRWPLAPPSHDGLARAVAARPPLVRRRRRAAASHAASSRGRLSRRVVTRPPVTPRRRAATYSRAYVAQRLLAPSSYDRLLCAVVARPPLAPSSHYGLSRRCRATTTTMTTTTTTTTTGTSARSARTAGVRRGAPLMSLSHVAPRREKCAASNVTAASGQAS